ncbi:MAG: UDP-3-O-(3-hydroxymyristoyl)glucosamine N-acyltransferase [Saprospiraceae bacterium]|nr:UDP-3-O-(3-hydroxymyristoyl)glucosamine N-acyltransferase [Saprospiraceae bacterium]MCB9345001.1 UDP-3-O-(3-hydroxymyristoyl)glucosamine N-acyltransferase [Lewinellaceae bacterium]
MTFTAAQIAQIIGGSVEGDPKASVTRPARIEDAVEGDFVFLDHPKYEPFAYSTQASILLLNKSFAAAKPIKPTLIRVDDVRGALVKLLPVFDESLNSNPAALAEKEQLSIHPDAQIGAGTTIGAFAVIQEGAVIGSNCIIYPQVFIGRNARIGDGCRIYPGVRIHFDCVIGNNCVLHANAVIGADGFGFAPQEDGSWNKVPQLGNVVLEDDVEIGACTCIDRASIGSTLIHKGVKLDNLIHIAHNSEVGENSVLAAQVGVAGSTHLGKGLQVGGQAGFAGHLKIADGTRIQAQSGLATNITEPNTALFGSPAIGYRDFIRSHVVFKHLPELQRKVAELEKMLKNIHDNLPTDTPIQ